MEIRLWKRSERVANGWMVGWMDGGWRQVLLLYSLALPGNREGLVSQEG